MARLISRVENNGHEAVDALVALYPHTGRAYLVGVTGAPGTGKSTLVNEITKLYRRQGQTVAILSIDPTSPFSGGAILGDRIRLRDLAGDRGIFMRSMATRGSLGGLAQAAAEEALPPQLVDQEALPAKMMGLDQQPGVAVVAFGRKLFSADDQGLFAIGRRPEGGPAGPVDTDQAAPAVFDGGQGVEG